jgi:hypothetical protein
VRVLRTARVKARPRELRELKRITKASTEHVDNAVCETQKN